MNSKERTTYEINRQGIISQKRSLRMRGKPYQHIKTPEKLAPLMGYEIIGADGSYEGFTLNYEEAIEYAENCNGTTHKRKAN